MTAATSGGPAVCPRPCVECGPAHHFSDAYLETAEEEPDAEPAKLGHPIWYVCKHCPAWHVNIDEDEDPGDPPPTLDDAPTLDGDPPEEGETVPDLDFGAPLQRPGALQGDLFRAAGAGPLIGLARFPADLLRRT